MPSSISLTGLSFTAPDGARLFDRLDLAVGPERAGLVGRNGSGKTTLLRLIAGELRPAAGTVRADGRIATLRQVVTPPPGETLADLLGKHAAFERLARAEAGLADADDLAEADWTLPARVEAALARFGLGAAPETPLAGLSGGQRTRASLAALVLDDPDFILLDEPTNNLDREGRDAVIGLLDGWKKGAIVVSHDRELLEHVDAIVELTTLGATRHGGNWSSFETARAVRLAAAERDLAEAGRLADQAAATARERAERQERRNASGRRSRARNDQPKILMNARKARAEETTGAGTRLAERMATDARAALDEARAKVETARRIAVEVQPTGLPAGRTVLRLDRVSAGYEPGRPVVGDLTLVVIGPERIAIVGPNGSGKSTLLALVAGRLAAWSGTVATPVQLAMLDQSASFLDPASTLAANFRRLNLEAGENDARAALARFEFRAEAGDRPVGSLSGGQTMRAGLACVLGGRNPPQLLVLDEPTNHLDLESIAAVEAGLAAYDGALLVVSHDEAFLEAIGITRRLQLPV